MNILMLDKSVITDRRIVLEAESLIQHGHQVILCAGRSSPQQNDLDVDKHLKIYRFFTNSLLEYSLNHTTPDELNTLARLLGQYKNQSKSRLQAYLKLAFHHPKLALVQMSWIDTPIPLGIHKTIQFLLAVYSFDIGLILASLRNFDLTKKIEQEIISIFKPDVIHCHDFSSLKTASQLAKKLHIPLIYDAHELYSYQPGIPKLISKLIFKNEKKLIQNAHTCITVNQQQADIMAKDFNYQNFLPITNSTVEPKDFNPHEKYDLIREHTNIPANEPIMLFQGGINRLRKIDLLLEGLAQVKQKIHMAFITFGNEVGEFKNMAKDLNIADRVHFLPEVPWEDMVYWAASADVGVLPYQADDMNTKISSPNKMYEFICSATPMIASSALINVHDVLTKEHFGVSYLLKEPKDYAKAIEIMFDSELGGPKRFKEALLTHRHRYLWAHEANTLGNFYQKLAETIEA
jgi:glycosyltransferase involved in cell wall biosynthesis